MYFNGHGVPQNYTEALKWYRKSAAKGHAPAQHSLANMLAGGVGVARNSEEAVEWFRKAAEQDFDASQNSLGLMYSNGLGVTRDLVSAYKWFALAARQGNLDAVGAIPMMKMRMTPIEISKAEQMAGEWLKSRQY